MTTQVDVAAAAAHEEISNAVDQIEKNIACHDDGGDDGSPLFRDEVQQQEMRYLDGLLIMERSSIYNSGAHQSADGVAGGGNQRKTLRLLCHDRCTIKLQLQIATSIVPN